MRCCHGQTRHEATDQRDNTYLRKLSAGFKAGSSSKNIRAPLPNFGWLPLACPVSFFSPLSLRFDLRSSSVSSAGESICTSHLIYGRSLSSLSSVGGRGKH